MSSSTLWTVVAAGALALGSRGALAQEAPEQGAPPQGSEQVTSESGDCSETTEVTFRSGSASLDRAGQRKVDEVAEWLRQSDERSAKVEGYADPSGSDEANDKLSFRRAKAVEKRLSQAGVDDQRITTFGRG